MPKFAKEKQIITEMLASVDITPNGNRPWDISVHDDSVYGRILSQGNLGLGEAYMQGLWDCPALDQFFYRIIRGGLDRKFPLNFTVIAHYLKNRFLNLQKGKAFSVKHYDIGNNLYAKMLDRRMTYTCGYWEYATDLDAAQEAKLELVCRKMGLKPGMKVLDIGCGWGSFMKYAAEKYGVSSVGITISQAQVDLGRQMCRGLPIEFRLQDYRETEGQYDRIVSLGMFEHVGFKNHQAYMKVVHKCLRDDGLFLLHTIGSNSSSPTATSEPWIWKYIFTQGTLPSAQQIAGAVENLFVLEDWQNFGADYNKTLLAWYHNFQEAWPDLKKDYNEVFFRMWKYYLLSCAGAFRARAIQVWQIVYSKNGVLGGYKAVRSLD
jgi:cyclopropane-fatty-acyl-phospholipid synthase